METPEWTDEVLAVVKRSKYQWCLANQMSLELDCREVEDLVLEGESVPESKLEDMFRVLEELISGLDFAYSYRLPKRLRETGVSSNPLELESKAWFLLKNSDPDLLRDFKDFIWLYDVNRGREDFGGLVLCLMIRVRNFLYNLKDITDSYKPKLEMADVGVDDGLLELIEKTAGPLKILITELESEHE